MDYAEAAKPSLTDAILGEVRDQDPFLVADDYMGDLSGTVNDGGNLAADLRRGLCEAACQLGGKRLGGRYLAPVEVFEGFDLTWFKAGDVAEDGLDNCLR